MLVRLFDLFQARVHRGSIGKVQAVPARYLAAVAVGAALLQSEFGGGVGHVRVQAILSLRPKQCGFWQSVFITSLGRWAYRAAATPSCTKRYWFSVIEYSQPRKAFARIFQSFRSVNFPQVIASVSELKLG